ncbi:hypothetical protein GUJ93_ZPchr0008g13442 [Zizania palustris]|uniref:Uncharacterized protein n=1 Tax=Zizania palustris TaxID=103762 RepID=A0A8J5RKS0_ZIZPA|nr:hypothetical protein GUJ93_ZPchr0008g13442 [Zizania palustris]
MRTRVIQISLLQSIEAPQTRAVTECCFSVLILLVTCEDIWSRAWTSPSWRHRCGDVTKRQGYKKAIAQLNT